MKLTWNGSVELLAGAIIGAGALAVACGGDDTTSTPSTVDGGSSGTAAKKALGEGPCATGDDCESNECFAGKKESYCSVKCDAPNAADPKCQALQGGFTGECNGQSYCKK